MKKIMETKKMTLAVILTSSILLAGIGTAIAHQNNNMNGCGNCGMNAAESQLDEKTIELRKKFHDETTDLRKKMFATRAEMRALMHSTSPDSKEAGRLAALMFDTKEQLRQKAEEVGLNKNGYGHMGSGGGMMGNRSGGDSNHPCDKRGFFSR